MRWFRLLVTTAALIASLAGCGGSSSSPKSGGTVPADAGATIEIKDVAFHPTRSTIKSGQAVVWVFDDGSIPHNVIGDGFRSSERTSGTFSHVFSRPGVYDYQCSIHAGMNGQVTVVS